MNLFQTLSIVAAAGLVAGAAHAQCSSSCGSKNTMSTTVAAGYGEKPTIVEAAVSAGQFETLVAAVKAAGLADALSGDGPFTVFAPTDAAFAALPKGTVEHLLQPENRETLQTILKYHVVSGKVKAKNVVELTSVDTLSGQRADVTLSGDTVMIDGARVVTTDIKCSNGIIHVIDAVIMPETNNIVETAAEAGTFNTLIAAAKAAGLAGVLQGDGPFTVFAPTDEAFAKLPAGTVESLLKPENKQQLANILKYHVVPGRVYGDTAVTLTSASTVLGQDLRLNAQADGLRINNSRVVATDIDTSNGVIHVIDTVLLPE